MKTDTGHKRALNHIRRPASACKADHPPRGWVLASAATAAPPVRRSQRLRVPRQRTGQGIRQQQSCVSPGLTRAPGGAARGVVGLRARAQTGRWRPTRGSLDDGGVVRQWPGFVPALWAEKRAGVAYTLPEEGDKFSRPDRTRL